MTEKYQEIGRNLSALEAFPCQWIREVGDRIVIPVKPDASVWAFLWHEAGLNTKQVRKLVGNKTPDWIIEKMIASGKQRLNSRETLAALRLRR